MSLTNTQNFSGLIKCFMSMLETYLMSTHN